MKKDEADRVEGSSVMGSFFFLDNLLGFSPVGKTFLRELIKCKILSGGDV